MTTTSFTSMDESTREQWQVIGAETARNQGRVADRVLANPVIEESTVTVTPAGS